MANQWFRMYAEFATDPKVQMLSEVDQRRYVMLLCLRCGNDDVTLHVTMTDESVAFQLRISNEEWAKTKAVLAAKNLINKFNLPVAWERRQYKSDTSAERVKAHRERKKAKPAQDVTLHETLQKQKDNGEVTPPDTDTDTDTDTEKNKTKEITPSADGEASVHADDQGQSSDEQAGRSKTVTKREMKTRFPCLTDRTIDDWLTVRKAHKAPLTPTAWGTIANEIEKSGLTAEQALKIAIDRSWRGLKAEWLMSHLSGGSLSGPPAKGPKPLHQFDKIDYSKGVNPDGSF